MEISHNYLDIAGCADLMGSGLAEFYFVAGYFLDIQLDEALAHWRSRQATRPKLT
jgi:hypothetical protein